MSGPDFKGEFRRLMTENAAAVIPALKMLDPWLMNKINRAAERYSLTEDEIIGALHGCSVLRFYFAKDPQKQGMHENTAAAYIREIPNVGAFKQLRGEYSVYLVDGGLVPKPQFDAMRKANPSLGHSKSMDFGWKYADRRFFAYHKYTEEHGGAQDNQISDAKAFMRQAAKNDTPDLVFIALCDGAYYGTPNGVLGRTKLESIAAIGEKAKHGNVFAMRTENLPEFMLLKFRASDPA